MKKKKSLVELTEAEARAVVNSRAKNGERKDYCKLILKIAEIEKCYRPAKFDRAG